MTNNNEHFDKCCDCNLCSGDSCFVQLQKLDFLLFELALYLDTHPLNREALRMFRQYLAKRPALVRQVKRTHGPLLITNHEGSLWRWHNNPWPWDMED